jgi:colicin import membrane protein
MSKNRHLLFFLAVSFLTGAVHAQNSVPASPGRSAEHQRINAARADIEQSFATSRAACYQVFFVNSCLDDANEKRRSGLAALRRQEVLLNERERKAKAAVQLRRLDEKARPAIAPSDEAAGAIQREREQAGRLAEPKSLGIPEASERPVPSSNKSVDRAKISREKADARADKATNEAEQTRKFVERQNKAQQRRQEHEQSQQNRTKPAARPLPAPL